MSTKESQSVSISPPVHLEFIQNQLENISGSAPEEIEQYHRALFLHQHAVEWEKYRQEARTAQDRIAFLAERVKDAEAHLGSRRKLVPATVDGQEDLKPTCPWNAWDIAMFAASTVGILCLITFGVLNISFNLLESGFVTFRESPFRSYLWAALLPVGALAVKIGWDMVRDERRRSRYLWSCLALGMLGVVVWVGAYACVYPTLSKGITEQIASLSVFDSSPGSGTPAAGINFAGAKWVDVITVSAQAVAEIFLSAVLGMYLTSLYARHRPVRLARDEAFVQLNTERRSLESELARERANLGHAEGNLLRLENQLQALLAYGKSLFYQETAKRQDRSEKREVILSEFSDHLRRHLDAIDRGNRLAATVTEPVGSGRNGS